MGKYFHMAMTESLSSVLSNETEIGQFGYAEKDIRGQQPGESGCHATDLQ
jgi:hypothetical protein